MFSLLFTVLSFQVDYTDLTSVLVWLSVLGAPYITGKVMAFVLENWKAWHKLPHAAKFLAPMLFSVGIATGAQVLLGYPELLGTLVPHFTLVITAVLAYLGSQQQYAAIKDTTYARSVKPL